VRKLNYAKLVPAWNVIVSSGMYVDDLDDAFAHEATLLGLLCLPIVLVCIAASWLVRRSLAGGLRRLSAAMLGLAEGNLTLAIPGLTRRDEVGAMARSVEVFKDGLIRGQAMEREAAEAAAAAAATREQAEAARAAAAAKLQEVVGGLAAGLSLLAKGDLGCSLTTSFAAEYETLRRDFNSAVGQLAGTMGQIVANTRAIASNTVEITSAADDLARRTEQQAASLEETTAALDRITTTVRETAEGAQKACNVVAAAQSGAQQSAEIVKEAVAAMTAIEGSSQQISQIIGVIDEIAFQTNLLALNAGVEAARAGDTGRGFAVVASEVRALAQRSADAAKEIKSLISVSGQEVARGVQLVGQTGRSLDSIVGQVEQISGVVVTIAASAREQATALSEVNVALNHMDQVTQQNAAMVEQSTAACHNLSGEAAELDRLTSQFSVERHAASG
jgi:methyl-accepting chemotaxis protein